LNKIQKRNIQYQTYYKVAILFLKIFNSWWTILFFKKELYIYFNASKLKELYPVNLIFLYLKLIKNVMDKSQSEH